MGKSNQQRIPSNFVEMQKIFNREIFKRGRAVELRGFDEDGYDISGTYIIIQVDGDVLKLYGIQDGTTEIQPYVYLSDLEKGLYNLAFYEPIELPYPEDNTETEIEIDGNRYVMGKYVMGEGLAWED